MGWSEGLEQTIPAEKTEKYGRFNIHAKSVCVAPCPFHAPSNHRLKDARIHIRTDKGFLVERICEHGVGHDDPDSVAYMQKNGHKWAGTHGCDGCCISLKLDGITANQQGERK